MDENKILRQQDENVEAGNGKTRQPELTAGRMATQFYTRITRRPDIRELLKRLAQ